ncbi:acyl-CoA dehydrogenase family protein [Pyrobaculum calidifontis]|uniref:Butyryl-CoA dehydrogenase n=1 Tax=Pyrobaculum calidifontis (strain DSM 21063 / JCM 11548 / VA1) TaxID=410359 RepID=A3MUE7_PYRCJ|nr:acyl-CoA dehydrogenase family protein [Pyrobaculum calidifontis]ABO08264.1 Butyryl-CoA dehydrogenase [Pyrobaculum calidifontis JCM 11548]
MVFPFDSVEDFSVVLTPEHEMFRKAVREFVEREVAPKAMEIEEKDEVPWDLLKKIAEQGFFGIGIPEKYGGQGGDHRMAVIMSEEFCRVLPGLSVYFGTNELFLTPILLFGTEEQKQKYVPPIARGEKFGAFAVTEPCCGSDVAGIQTKAEKVGNKWVINGRKAFISSSDVADYFIVLARTYPPPDKKLRYLGLTFFIVEKGTPGFKIEQCYHKMGLHGNHVCELVFENVEVPDENRVGEEGMGFLYAMETFDRTRIGVAAQAVGMMQGVFEKAFQYVHQRQAFGLPIAAFQAIQFSLVEMMTKIMTARLLTYLAAKLADENRKEFTFVASLAKYYATSVAEEVISEAINLHGGVGVIVETGVERYLRDVKITQIYEGANNIQKLVAYRQLIRILKEKGQIPDEIAKFVT